MLKKKKKALSCYFYLNFSSFAHLSFSLTSSSPAFSSLAFPPRRRNRREDRASGAVSCSSLSRFFGAWIKVAFRAAIVRVIRKSYLQRVRVARERREPGGWETMRVCECVRVSVYMCGSGRFFFFFLSPSNAWNYTCHLPVCVLRKCAYLCAHNRTFSYLCMYSSSYKCWRVWYIPTTTHLPQVCAV